MSGAPTIPSGTLGTRATQPHHKSGGARPPEAQAGKRYICLPRLSPLRGDIRLINEATPPRDQSQSRILSRSMAESYPTDYTIDRQATGTRSRANLGPCTGAGAPLLIRPLYGPLPHRRPLTRA